MNTKSTVSDPPSIEALLDGQTLLLDYLLLLLENEMGKLGSETTESTSALTLKA